MIPGQKKLRKESPKIKLQTPTNNLRLNGGGLNYQALSPLAASNSVIDILPSRPFTANRNHSNVSRSRERLPASKAALRTPTSPFSRGLSQSSINLQMAPLTVPLLPSVDHKTSSKRRSSSRTSRSPSPRKVAYSSTGKNLAGQSTIQLLRPNNTVVAIQKIEYDRRGLTAWPNYTGSEPPRLLSMQHNMITKLEPPIPLPTLVLLDLYHNHIRNLEGVKHLPNLKILLLAKNRLGRLDGLDVLTKLEVLDLHGNQIQNLQGLSHLKELRVLNLAGNMLRHANGFKGLDSLTELNLRRNQIRTVSDLNLLPKLEKVFLSYNEIYKYEDINCLMKCLKLRELCLEENPISKQPLYFHTANVKFYRLRKLDNQDLTSELRKQSEKILQKAKDKELAKAAQITDEESRTSAIISAKRHWKTLKAAQLMIIRKPKNKLNEDKNKSLEQTKSLESNATDNLNAETNRIQGKMHAVIVSTTDGNVISQKEPRGYTFKTSGKSIPNKFELSRSKSYFDLKQSQLTVDQFETSSPVRPKSSISFKQRAFQKTTNPDRELEKPNMERKNLKLNGYIDRRNSESKLSCVVSGSPPISKRDDRSSSNHYYGRQLKKSDSNTSLKSLPDGILAAAVTRIQSNLQRLQTNVEASFLKDSDPKRRIPDSKVQNMPGIISADVSDDESDSTSSSSSSSDTISSINIKRSSSQIDLRIPYSGNKHSSRAESPSLGDRNASGILREQGPNYLAELEDNVLRLFGNGALRCTDLAWDKTAAGAATTAQFQYINYDDILDIFVRLRVRFPRLENFVFVETGLVKYGQLNALAELHQVSSICISTEGNPITEKLHWQHYAGFRLSHWGLSKIDNTEITEDVKQETNSLFAPLSVLAYSCLPRQQLLALTSSRSIVGPTIRVTSESDGFEKTENLGADDLISGRHSPNGLNIQELIGKEALQYRPPNRLSKEEVAALAEASKISSYLLKWVLDSVRQLHQLDEVWPSILHDLTRDAITDVVRPNYGKVCLDSLTKDLGWKK